jgi:hypothetical protein
VCRADIITIFMYPLSSNLEASNSWKPQGLSRTVITLLYLFTLLAKQMMFLLKFLGNNLKSPIWLGKIFLTLPDRNWGPPSLPYKWYRFLLGVKRPGRGVYRSTEIKENVTDTSTPRLVLRGLFWLKFTFNFTVTISVPMYTI